MKDEKLAKFCIVLLTLPFGFAAHALIIQQWWEWFLTPHGAGVITLVQAMLLRFAAFMLTADRRQYVEKDKTLTDFIAELFTWAILAPAMFWLIGWIFKTWLLQ